MEKKDGVFLISDTAISKNKKESEPNIGSFGERFGIYGEHSIKESEIKIVKINDKIVIAYSGVVIDAKNAIDYFKINIDISNLEKSLEILEKSNEKPSFELIIVCNDGKNSIYYFNGLKVIEIDDFVDIGSGKDKQYFSQKVKDYTKDTNKRIEIHEEVLILQKDYKFDEDEHLVNVIAYVQGLSVSENLLQYDAGGLFFGLYIKNDIKWCKDLLYYIFNGDIENFKTVSVIERFDTVFSYSDYNNIIRCYSNDIDEYKDIAENKYIQKHICKALMENFPKYIILSNNSNNNIFINKISKWPYNNFFKMWMKRNENNTKYAFAFADYNENLSELVENINDDIKLYNLICEDEGFMPREDYMGQYSLDKVEDIEIEYDYDLRSLEYDYQINDKFIIAIDENIDKFYNIVVIDYKYLFDGILEKYNEYKFAKINLQDLKLELLIDNYFINIASKEFDKYVFYIIKDNSDPCLIGSFSIYDWLRKYDNCEIFEVENGEAKNVLCKFIFEIMRKYYFDEKYFSIDKVILCCDNLEVNGILKYLPKINIEFENPDIFLIRNLNYYTNMDGRFRYVVLDYALPFMLGYNNHQIALLESGYDPKDEE